MKQNLKYFFFIQFFLFSISLFSSQKDFAKSLVINWLIDQALIANKPLDKKADKKTSNEDAILEEIYFQNRQNAVAEMPVRTFSTKTERCDVSSNDGIYDDGFDKIWKRQELQMQQALAEEKRFQLKLENYYEEPVRKRHRTEK